MGAGRVAGDQMPVVVVSSPRDVGAFVRVRPPHGDEHVEDLRQTLAPPPAAREARGEGPAADRTAEWARIF